MDAPGFDREYKAMKAAGDAAISHQPFLRVLLAPVGKDFGPFPLEELDQLEIYPVLFEIDLGVTSRIGPKHAKDS